MNLYHQRLCRSPRWAEYVAGEMIPAAVEGVSLAGRVLELGPGYGASTYAIRDRVHELVALESDQALAAHLRSRFGSSVEVVLGDATDMPFEDSSFSAVLCFTMLHHLRDRASQERLFAEVARVLEPGGMFVARDSSGGWRFRLIHWCDVCTPLEPRRLRPQLDRAGLRTIEIVAQPGSVHFKASRPMTSEKPTSPVTVPVPSAVADPLFCRSNRD
ncbi:MAG: methyltransferase domain-containing protein [Candidatus Dormiibacterota bacterium]